MSEHIHSFFQLHLVCSMPGAVALAAVRAALSEANVYVTDIRHLSSMASVLHVMLKNERWTEMLNALSGSGASVDAPDPGYPGSLKQDDDGDIFGTIQLLYGSDEPERRDAIPLVPG